MELLSLQKMPREAKIALLKELGYDSDGVYVVDASGARVVDRYIHEEVRLDNMVIFPGSVIILNNNPLSIAAYLEEFGDVF